MLFNVRQRGRLDETDWRKPRLSQAVTFFARTLRIPHPKELDISLLLSARMRLVTEGEYGNVSPRMHSLINKHPHQFVMEIQRDLPWTQTLKTFAHEMVHVKQYASGQLRLKWDSNNSRWLDSWMNGPWVDKKTIPYDERPWEIDAKAQETPLLEAFFKVEETTGITYGG